MGRKAASYYPEPQQSYMYSCHCHCCVGNCHHCQWRSGACIPTDPTASAVAVGETSTAPTRSRMVATIFLTSTLTWMPPLGRNKPGTMWQKNLGSVAVGFRPPQCGREYRRVCVGLGDTARPLSCSTSRRPRLLSHATQIPDFSLRRSEKSLFYESMCRAASFLSMMA